MLEALAQSAGIVPNRDELERAARASLARDRLPRIDGAERAQGPGNLPALSPADPAR